MKQLNKILLLTLLTLLLISSVSAFQIEKHLVQLEVDEDYPCHIENLNEIVCPSLNQIQINQWKDKISNLPEEEKDKGKYKDNEKKDRLSSRLIPYEKGDNKKDINILNEYREKVDVYKLDKEIKIGFATNVFAVSGTPLENFDVSTTTGMVRYRPLNMTWLNFDGVNDQVDTPNFNLDSNHSGSVWIKTSDIRPQLQYILWDGTPGGIGMTNGSAYIQHWNNTGAYFRAKGGLINNSIWHHLVYTQNDSSLVLYLDGIVTAINNSYSGSRTRVRFDISNSNYFNGSIDEVRIYNNTLSQANVIQIYNSGRVNNLSLNTNNLVSYYPFSSNSGLVLFDLFNSLNGTITGATWQSDNINVTTLGYWVNISIVNMTNALVYNSSLAIINSSMTGSKNFEFYENETIYILDNFEVNEASPLPNSPTWFSSSTTTEKHIASNLTGQINTSITVTVKNCQVKGVTYTPDSGTQVSPTWTCSGTQFTISGVQVNTASSSNVLSLTYYNIDTSLCEDLMSGMAGFFGYLPTIGLMLGVLIIIVILGGLIYTVMNPGWYEGMFNFEEAKISTGMKITIAVFVSIFIIATIAVVGIVIISSMCYG